MIKSAPPFSGPEADSSQLPPLFVILPAFNEESRIIDTIQTYSSFLLNTGTSHIPPSFQILVVDDGSQDQTARMVQSCNSNHHPTICLSLSENQGKGAAVAHGVKHVAETVDTAILLIADADGSGNIRSLEGMVQRLEELLLAEKHVAPDNSSIWNTPALVNGYREYNGTPLKRSVLRWGFRTTVRLFCGNALAVSDTQCGFKLMTLSAAKSLYRDLHLQRWTHDVEVLYRANEYGFAVAEHTVQWQDKGGSKLVTESGGVVGISLLMLSEVLYMRIQYLLGRWKLPDPVQLLLVLLLHDNKD